MIIKIKAKQIELLKSCVYEPREIGFIFHFNYNKNVATIDGIRYFVGTKTQVSYRLNNRGLLLVHTHRADIGKEVYGKDLFYHPTGQDYPALCYEIEPYNIVIEKNGTWVFSVNNKLKKELDHLSNLSLLNELKDENISYSHKEDIYKHIEFNNDQMKLLMESININAGNYGFNFSVENKLSLQEYIDSIYSLIQPGMGFIIKYYKKNSDIELPFDETLYKNDVYDYLEFPKNKEQLLKGIHVEFINQTEYLRTLNISSSRVLQTRDTKSGIKLLNEIIQTDSENPPSANLQTSDVLMKNSK